MQEPTLDRRWSRLIGRGFGAPPVVAVMMTSDPGDWFDATLESLAEQDYGSLSVLVIDNGGADGSDRTASPRCCPQRS